MTVIIGYVVLKLVITKTCMYFEKLNCHHCYYYSQQIYCLRKDRDGLISNSIKTSSTVMQIKNYIFF